MHAGAPAHSQQTPTQMSLFHLDVLKEKSPKAR